MGTPSAAGLAERLARVRAKPLPRHVALIMDGNGRWAGRRGLPRMEGHRAGVRAAERLVRFVAEERLVPCLSLFAFSTENWNRPQEEVESLFQLLEAFLRERAEEYVDRGSGSTSSGGGRGSLHLCRRRSPGWRSGPGTGPPFSSRWGSTSGAVEHPPGVRRALALGAEGQLSPAELDEARFSTLLPTAGLPDPDLVVRTGDEKRISNFFLWEAAYAELHFTSTLWPDFDEEAFLRAIEDFQGRVRRFGRVSP